MPDGMKLRSQIRDPNLSSPIGDLSLVNFLSDRGVDPADYPIPTVSTAALGELSAEMDRKYGRPAGDGETVGARVVTEAEWNPLPIQLFREYGEWFIRRTGIEIVRDYVNSLTRHGEGFEATTRSGETIRARFVVLAIGQRYYRVIPEELQRLPAGRCLHTSQLWDLSTLEGQRVLIVGGGQSALEWAALIGEAGAEVFVADRGAPRQFGTLPYEAIHQWKLRVEEDPGWFRTLPVEEQDHILRHPLVAPNDAWLLPKLCSAGVRLYPDDPWKLRSPQARRIVGAHMTDEGRIAVSFKDGGRIEVDRIVCGTGFRVNVDRLEFVEPAIRRNVERLEGPGLLAGYPQLWPNFESTVPGLYFAGYAAQGCFGNVLNFVDGVRLCTRIIAGDLLERVKEESPASLGR